jgi:hypothetical protein
MHLLPLLPLLLPSPADEDVDAVAAAGVAAAVGHF